MPAIITLTTDFGLEDEYVGVLKGIAAALTNGTGFTSLGPREFKEKLIKLASPTLQIDRIHGNIAGSVIHIDHFGNLSTNIHQRDLAGLTADPNAWGGGG